MYSLVKSLLGVMAPRQRRAFLVLQAFVILTALAEVVSVASIGPFMALVGNISLIESNEIVSAVYVKSGLKEPLDFLFWLGLGVLLLLLVAALISIYTIWRLSIFAAHVGAEFGDSLYELYMNKDFIYHSNVNSSILTKQIATEVSRVTDNVLQPFVQINARIVASIFISAAVFIYNPVIALSGLLLFSFCYFLLFYIVKGRLEKNGAAISKVSKSRFKLMSEGFGAIKEVQLLGREYNLIKKFRQSGVIFSESYGSSNGLYNMPRYLMEFVVYSAMIGLVLILIGTHEGDLSEVLPVLAVFGVSAFKLLPSFQQIYTGLAQIKSNVSAFDAIKDDLYAARLAAYEKNTSENECSLKNTLGEGPLRLELKGVNFKYPGKEIKVLDGIDLVIEDKSVVGIVGASGSGKSTILDIMLGLIEPDSGCLMVGGREIDKTNRKVWQRKVGYVAQDIYIKDGTIAENIAFGLEGGEIDFAKIEAAIKLSHLSEFIESLPDGVMTNVGERGVQISGGQRQRIGIARSLYDDPDYLFFDEATSALDGITENIIMEEIDIIGGEKTIVMIAHRLNTLIKCDKIYFISEGRVVDQGDYCSLMESNEKFRKMAKGEF